MSEYKIMQEPDYRYAKHPETAQVTRAIEHSMLYGPQIYGEAVRELLAGKYEVIPATKDHIIVDAEKCNGCRLCYTMCPTGSWEMIDGKASPVYHKQLCGECGVCRYVCRQDAITWSYPEGGTGISMKFT